MDNTHREKINRFLKETAIKKKTYDNTIINIQDKKVFNKIPFRKRSLDLNVRLSKVYDKNKDDTWNYNKTFKRMEKYSRNLEGSIFNRKSINHYITRNLTYDSYGINLLDGSEEIKT